MSCVGFLWYKCRPFLKISPEMFNFDGESVQGMGFQKNFIRKFLFQVPLFIAAIHLVKCFSPTVVQRVMKGLVSKGFKWVDVSQVITIKRLWDWRSKHLPVVSLWRKANARNVSFVIFSTLVICFILRNLLNLRNLLYLRNPLCRRNLLDLRNLLDPRNLFHSS